MSVMCVCVSLCTCFQYRDSDIDRDMIYGDNIIHNSNIQCLLYFLSMEAMNATTISPNRIAIVNYMINVPNIRGAGEASCRCILKMCEVIKAAKHLSLS